VIRKIWRRQTIRPGAWGAAVLTCGAVALFIAMAEPQGGSSTPTTGAWTSTVVSCALGAGVLALASLRGSPARRAGLLATACAITWALEAAFIKAMTDTLTQDGIGGAFTHWPIYAVAIGGVAGVLLEQSAIHVGPLRISQPLLVIVDPVVSIVLSIHLFDERFVESSGKLALASFAFVAMCAGVVLLCRTVPETMAGDLPVTVSETR
jgi:hypothetical protein